MFSITFYLDLAKNKGNWEQILFKLKTKARQGYRQQWTTSRWIIETGSKTKHKCIKIMLEIMPTRNTKVTQIHKLFKAQILQENSVQPNKTKTSSKDLIPNMEILRTRLTLKQHRTHMQIQRARWTIQAMQHFTSSVIWLLKKYYLLRKYCIHNK